MKYLFEQLRKRVRSIAEGSIATKDRPAGFQIFVTTVLTTAVLCVIYYIIKTMA